MRVRVGVSDPPSHRETRERRGLGQEVGAELRADRSAEAQTFRSGHERSSVGNAVSPNRARRRSRSASTSACRARTRRDLPFERIPVLRLARRPAHPSRCSEERARVGSRPCDGAAPVWRRGREAQRRVSPRTRPASRSERSASIEAAALPGQAVDPQQRGVDLRPHPDQLLVTATRTRIRDRLSQTAERGPLAAPQPRVVEVEPELMELGLEASRASALSTARTVGRAVPTR